MVGTNRIRSAALGAVLALVTLLLASTAGTAAPHQAAAAGAGATGNFEVVDGRIFAPDGRRFVPVGTNLNGPNSFFDVPSKGLASLLQRSWSFNTVRLVTCLPQGCQGEMVSRVNNDLDGIVEEFTSRGMVVIIEYHQLRPGATASQSDIATAVTFWRDKARRFGDNPYVWFNLFNEPEANYHDYEIPGTAPERWRAQHQPVIDAVRAEGAPNVIVIDDTQAGQGAADWWDISPSPDEDSGIISEGANLVDPERRLVFSVHAYDVWGFPNNGSADCSGRYTDDQRDARFRSYVERVRDRGLALIVGELGFRATDEEEFGLSDHGERFGQQPPCGSTQRLAAETVYRVAPEFELGVLTWHGYGLVREGGQRFRMAGDPPRNLTRMGELQLAHARAMALATAEAPPPDGDRPPASPTTAPVPVPDTTTTTTEPGVAAPPEERKGAPVVVVLVLLAAAAAGLGTVVALRRRRQAGQ